MVRRLSGISVEKYRQKKGTSIHKRVASIASWWTSFLATEKRFKKRPNDIACTRALRLKTLLAAKGYLDINIYTYIIPSHTEHNSTTTTTTTTTHAHPYLYITYYIYILYYINVYYIYEYEKNSSLTLIYYYTGVHAIGICETPVCVSRTITCFSLFANNTLMITPLLVVSRICIIVSVNNSFVTVTNWCVARSRFRCHNCGNVIFHPLIIALV